MSEAQRATLERLQTALTALAAERAAREQAEQERDDYKECYLDSKKMAKLIGDALNGEGAARQPSLCDLVRPVEALQERVEALEQALREIAGKSCCEAFHPCLCGCDTVREIARKALA